MITRQRMFYEVMEDVLPGQKVIITDGKTQEMFPLEQFAGEAVSADDAGSGKADNAQNSSGS